MIYMLEEFEMASEKPWYENRENFIKEIDSEEWGITELMGRKSEDGSWEYAVVFWRYQTAYVRLIVKDGKVTEDGTN